MISPPVLAACPASEATGPIASSTLAAGGVDWAVTNAFLVTGGSADAFGVVDTISPAEITLAITDAAVGNTSAITAVNQGLKTFAINVDLTDSLATGVQFDVQSSTGNDGTYTTASFSVLTGVTTITTVEAIPNATADGNLITYGQLTVAGDHTADFPATTHFLVLGSIGNDGIWTTMLPIFAAGSTQLFVALGTQIGNNTMDGNVNSVGAIATYHLTDPGTTYTTANNVPISAIGPGAGGGTGAALNIVV